MFKDSLARLFEEKIISKTDLSRQMGVSRSTIYEWLDGNSGATVDQIEKMSIITGLPISYFTACATSLQPTCWQQECLYVT